jgi:UDP-N-acetylmuramoylalanine--D-glutamate ligase
MTKTFDIVVLGSGESGTGAALLAHAKGLSVFVSDSGTLADGFRKDLSQAGIPFEEGTHTLEILLQAREVIKSPGIPPTAPVVVALVEAGIPVLDELELAFRDTRARFVGITGSNGKTTTTLLTYHLMQAAGLSVGLAGNIGKSLARQVIEDQFDWYVLEISSFQLDGMETFACDIAILTNITPDHLDRYQYKFEHYIDSKFRIAKNLSADQTLVVHAQDVVVMPELEKRNLGCRILPVALKADLAPVFVAEGALHFTHVQPAFSIPVSDLPISGDHNLLNALMAVAAVALAGGQPDVLQQAISSFRNAPHRCEPIGSIGGIHFVNDSKATNVDSVKHAFSAFQKPICWIAGGVDKGNDYTELEEAVHAKVDLLICLGKDNAKLKKHFGGTVPLILETQSVQEVVSLVLRHAKPGTTALLSPACASFDLFRNYEDRGNQFRAAVQAMFSQTPISS